MPSILLYVLAAALYGALGLYFWRTRWHGADGGPVPAHPLERLALVPPFAIHTYLLYHALFVADPLRFGFGQALSAMLWLGVLIYSVESLFVKLEGMQVLVLPLAAVSVLLPALFPGIDTPANARGLEFRMHLLIAMLAYSLFTIAALHALLMSFAERRLHAGAVGGPLAGLPPLLTLESLLFRIIGLGFILLTLTLATGIAYHEELFGRPFRLDHKTLFGTLSWLIFGGLLAGRRLWGWRGKRALRWTMAGFGTLLLAYVGSRFVLEVLLHRSLG